MAAKKETKKRNPENDAPTITLDVVNPAISGKPPVIYKDVPAVLKVTLTNLTASAVIIPQGNKIEIFMPGYFTVAEVKAISISNISVPGLAFSYSVDDNCLLLTHSGADFSWANNATVQFTIENVRCAEQEGNDTIQINPDGFRGFNIPVQITETILLQRAPLPTRVNLKDVLAVNTQYGGLIYVSVVSDALTNSLYLEVKNTGKVPLYHGDKPRTALPKITVSFVYGNTSGSLAPDNKQTATQKGSTWGISAAVSVDQTGGWTVENPQATGAANSPSWVMSPRTTNKQIIGVGDQANVCFEFSNIFAFTPTGSTQMHVQFSDFPQNNEQMYNDCSFVLPIIKRSPPEVRGIVTLRPEKKYVIDKIQNMDVQLHWIAFYTASIELDSDASPWQDPKPYKTAYDGKTPFVYGTTTLLLPDVEPDTKVMFTIDAFDTGGKILRPDQYAVAFERRSGIYEFSGPSTPVSFTMDTPSPVEFNWKVYQARKIQICSGDTVLFEKTYAASPKWNTGPGTGSIKLSGITHTLPITMKCFDGQGRPLGTADTTVQFIASTWRDPKDNKMYPIVRVGNQIWLGSNYDYNDPQGGSFWYDNDQKYEARFGRLYTKESAIRNIPVGWRLPVDADWGTLIHVMKSNSLPEVPTEVTPINLVFGGAYSAVHESSFMCIDMVGVYMGRAVKPGCFANFCVLMASTPPQIEHQDLDTTPPDPSRVGFSVRYIIAAPGSEEYEEGIEGKGNPMSEATLKKLLKGAGLL